MSTVITRICTPDGFVIAADGRKSRSGTGETLTDEQQKIFSIEHPGRRLAYAFAGVVDLTHSESEKVLFDFVDETNKAVIKLGSGAPKTIWHFATMLADSIIEGIEAVKQGPEVFDQSIENSLTHLFICGYYGTHAKSVCLDFTHHLSERSELSLSSEKLSELPQYGSEKVISRLHEEDPLFSAYATPKESRRNPRLPEAIKIVHRDVLAHFDPVARTIDGPTCNSVGGRIHIATVTFVDGFAWVPGFEPKDQR